MHPSMHPSTVYQRDHDKQWFKDIEGVFSKEMNFFRSRMNSIEVTWRGRVHKVCGRASLTLTLTLTLTLSLYFGTNAFVFM